jgi:hypothetical protein
MNELPSTMCSFAFRMSWRMFLAVFSCSFGMGSAFHFPSRVSLPMSRLAPETAKGVWRFRSPCPAPAKPACGLRGVACQYVGLPGRIGHGHGIGFPRCHKPIHHAFHYGIKCSESRFQKCLAGFLHIHIHQYLVYMFQPPLPANSL